jgi:4-deoxy-L-threo-5-hexosulose-uronate ketol-isomerase
MLTMRMRAETDRTAAGRMTSIELRQAFLIEGLFAPGKTELVYAGLDRAVVGSAVPVTGKLALGPTPELRSAFLCERRELGILNIGGSGAVTVDGTRYAMAARDALYVGRGSQRIAFESEQPASAARFYLVSYPAHAALPTRQVRREDAQPTELGSRRDANERTIYKYIHAQGAQSCQIVMGFTQLKEGSVWNTMPPHTHQRRTEIYLYFDLEPETCVMHFMGTPDATRHLVVRNEQAVLSPEWSIHSGVGTRHYCFAWAMGGENQEFTDMDAVKVSELF